MRKAVCGKGSNEAAMMQAFIFCQSGYKIRLGFTQNRDLRLLFKSEHLIFDLNGLKMNDGLPYIEQRSGMVLWYISCGNTLIF